MDGPEQGSWHVLVDCLEQVQVLRDADGRRLCLELLNETLGISLQVQESDYTRRHLFSILLACRRQHPRAMWALIEVLERLEPGAHPVRRARRLLEDMAALELVPNRERERLLDLLTGALGPHVTTIVRDAAGNAAPELPMDDHEPDELLVLLEQLNARPDGIPPLLAFVEFLASYLEDHRRDQLQAWCNRQADRMGLTDELLLLRRDRRDVTLAIENTELLAYLVIRLERDPLGGEVFTLTPWRQLDPHRWQPRQGTSFTGDLAGIQRQVASLVEDAESTWAKEASAIIVEFLLPFELLNLPVDQWDLEQDSGLPRPLGPHYQVVVRSLDRARTRKWHREWRRRWALLKALEDTAEPEVDRAWFWSEAARARALSRLEAKLSIRQDVLSLVLRSRPDESTERSEVLVGLRTGVPVMIWQRSDGARPVFEKAVRDMLDGLCSLRERTRMLRSAAEQSARPPGHVGSRITLLWDDPERLVEPVDLPGNGNDEEVSAS
ncbi:VMAP-C domain-containing protein [Amycolatopsis magusensis]|uniref:VMAP-C domain-containing protein n=1 Tax=Amycolatopsis magusensis TaxID=882444 RepID=UPI003788538C